MWGNVGRNTTMFSFTGFIPTLIAASTPFRTGARAPRRISRKAAGSKESTDTLTRLSPALRSDSARPASMEPFVVNETSSMCTTVRAMISSRSIRTSGSPPVNLTELMSNSRATRANRSTSRGVTSSPWALRGLATGPNPSS